MKRNAIMAKGGVAVAALALVVSGCSSSSSSSSGSSSASRTGSDTGAQTQQSFKVMVIGDLTSPLGFVAPEALAAVKGYFRHVPGVEVLSCDSKGNAGASQACERNAVQKKVAAVIITFSPLYQNQAILNRAGIPTVGVTDTSSPTSFSALPSLSAYAAMGVGMAKEGCKRIGVLYLDGTETLRDTIKNAAESAGSSVAASATTPYNAPDIAPAIAKLTGANVDCIALSIAPNQVVQSVTAIKQSGKNIRIGGAAALFPPQVTSALGSSINGVLSFESNVDAMDTVPVVAKIKADMQAIDPKQTLTLLAVGGWASAKIIDDALPAVKGPVTASSLLVALNGLRNASTEGAIPPFSAVELPNPAYRRAFNHYGITYKFVNGVPKRQGDFYDVAGAFR
jgi:ABC-type branched-subunit amino acid transport system substrate-binding protein